MSQVQVIIKQVSGQTIVLSPEDKLVQEATSPCESKRCASRHGQDTPVDVVIATDGSSGEFFELGFHPLSPLWTGSSKFFCTPTCLKDWVTYEYLAPSRASVQKIEHTDDGPKWIPDPETSAVIDTLSGQLPGTIPYVGQAESQADGCSDPADVHGA